MTATLTNPLREGLRLARTPEPACLVIFGASGDLTARKLMPALYNLALQHLLPASFAVIGSSRRAMSADAFRTELHDAVAEFSRTRPINEEVWATFARSIHYVPTPNDSGFDELSRVLGRIDRDRRARRLLRQRGRDARHRAEPSPAAPRARRHGASVRVRRSLRARREGQGATRAPADRAR